MIVADSEAGSRADGRMDEMMSIDEARYVSGIGCDPVPISLSGTQALVRLALVQAARDQRAGLDSGGFITGYRGSPLGGVDIEMWRAQDRLRRADIVFAPAINEDLAATALIGTQKVETDPSRKKDGVFALWYGKGPGVDRSGDAFRHGNAYGSSPHGGVLVVAGDDHGCVSSSMSFQSDHVLWAWGMPVIHPACVEDFVRFGLWGWALSRFSGLWVGFKAISDTVETTVSIDPGDLSEVEDSPFVLPAVDPGPDGLHWRWPDLPGQQIERRHRFKMAAAIAFARANPLDRLAVHVDTPRLLIAAVGKAYLDTLEALRLLGTTPEALAVHGVAILKVGLVAPLSPQLEMLATQASEVIVVEEKAPMVEPALMARLYRCADGARPVVTGKHDITGAELLPWDAELRPTTVAAALANRLREHGVPFVSPEPSAALPVQTAAPRRTPHMCAGCPHNASTVVPEGSRAQLGIGCHALAAQIPGRNTSGSVQMGGEGGDWLGQSPFVSESHVFQNLGDGTFFHSGHLAIRQAVAAGLNITYKILYNGSVAMTGGQPIDGELDVPQITRMVAAEGVGKIVVLAEDVDVYPADARFAPGTAVLSRERLDEVQRELRAFPGVSVLVYDQACTLQIRRSRRLGLAPAKPKMFINEAVCEGCGDCQEKSNCVAIVPVETAFGRKRQIDQEQCTSDMSCLTGYCPSFVTVHGAQEEPGRNERLLADALARELPLPSALPVIGEVPYSIVTAGIGGTGIVTMAGIINHAAHLDGRPASTLQFSGFAQKGGTVISQIRIARAGDRILHSRIVPGGADALIAADLTVATQAETLELIGFGRTRAVASLHETQVGAMLRNGALRIDTHRLLALLQARVGAAGLDVCNPYSAATHVLGAIYANIFLLGYCWQSGLLPLTLSSLQRAIASSRHDAERNQQAFHCGRLAAIDPGFFSGAAPSAAVADTKMAESDEERESRRERYLILYQNAAYARRYRCQIDSAAEAAERIGEPALRRAVADNLFKVMAYKDEYEVCRLQSDPELLDGLRTRFGRTAKPEFNFHVPYMLTRGKADAVSRPIRVPAFFLPAIRTLARFKFLRGTRLDPFGRQAIRVAERRLLDEYERMIAHVLPRATRSTATAARRAIEMPQRINGYGDRKIAAISLSLAELPAMLTVFETAEQTADQAIVPAIKKTEQAMLDTIE